MIISRVRNKINSLKNQARTKVLGGAPPIYPAHNDGGLKIHLGAGPINLQGWINIDARPSSHIHLCSEGFELNQFTDGAVSQIYMCHVLEHFSFEEVKAILAILHKKLAVGGVLRIAVPDFDRLIEVYQKNDNNLEIVKFALMGGQDYEYNFHKAVFNAPLLSELLTSCGFTAVEHWETLAEFGAHLNDWSEAMFDTPAGSFPISLNLKAIKAAS